MDYETFKVKASDREPLREFIVNALEGEGCHIIHSSRPKEAPFRLTFETADGERLGIVCYAFRANTKKTVNRPEDEHRFQVKYGSKDGKRHTIWQDPFGLYVTLFCGINPDLGIFVAADPWLHSPTKFFISVEFKEEHVQSILASPNSWYAWERHRRKSEEPVEVLVGGTAKSFLRYVRFEREALREDQGHRQLLAEKIASGAAFSEPAIVAPREAELVLVPSPVRVHALAREFDLDESAVLDLISRARMLKMAVRGYVAEEHLLKRLSTVRGVTDCRHTGHNGGPDVTLRFEGSDELAVECKNALRQKTAKGEPRVDFKRTRDTKKDPCSRFYRITEFDLIAACLHAITERWEFCFAVPWQLDEHKKCPGRLSNNVRVDERWTEDAVSALRLAAEAG